MVIYEDFLIFNLKAQTNNQYIYRENILNYVWIFATYWRLTDIHS